MPNKHKKICLKWFLGSPFKEEAKNNWPLTAADSVCQLHIGSSAYI